jgi:hypothetical protein
MIDGIRMGSSISPYLHRQLYDGCLDLALFSVSYLFKDKGHLRGPSMIKFRGFQIARANLDDCGYYTAGI